MYASTRQRAFSALASFAIVAGIAAALVAGLRPNWRQAARAAFTAVDLASPPQPERDSPRPAPQRRPAPSAAKGDPAPRSLKNRAAPVFVPPVPPSLVQPPPIAAAPAPDVGDAAGSGAALLPGPGQGAGGPGTGSGGGGNGGNGSGSGAVKGPRQIKGRLSYADLPQGLLVPGQEAGATVRYTVNADGTVSGCRIDRSSGLATLDMTACRLIEQRFRFRPARDRAGHPVPATIVEDHVWIAREGD